ncbi:MAG: hypothetical protein ACT4ON_06595 [Bacteroidota bacterium]
MNKKSAIFFSIIIAILVFSACNPSDKYKADIQQLDSLSHLLDSSQMKLLMIDTAKILTIETQLKANLDSVEQNSSDTISREQALLLSEYSSSQNVFEKIKQEYVKLSSEIKRSKTQILNLIHDLTKGNLEEEQAAKYVQEEKNIANDLIKSVDVLEGVTKETLEKFETNNPKVLEFIEVIKLKQSVVK